MIIKRITVLVLSFVTLICYGKAIKGLAGYLVGKGNPLLIVGGMILGTLCAYFSMKVWQSYLIDLTEIIDETKENQKNNIKSQR